jgi:hypothetical protein
MGWRDWVDTAGDAIYDAYSWVADKDINPGDPFDIAGKVSNIGPEDSRLRGIAEAAGGFLDTTSGLTSKFSPITGPPRLANWLASPTDPPQPTGGISVPAVGGWGTAGWNVPGSGTEGLDPWGHSMIQEDYSSTGVPPPPNIDDASRTAREHQGLPVDWLEQGQIDEQYAQMYDDLRSMADDEFTQATAGQDPNVLALREQYLAALGGANGAGGGYGSTLGSDLTYFDDRLNRALSYIDAQEQNLVADINELEELKRLGIAGAAERQREMLDELELVRSERLRTDEAAMANRAAGLEQTRLENEAAIIADISTRGQGAVSGHQARMQASQDRLREMGIDPSQITPDETLAMLESQARRNDTYSERIAGIEAGRSADRDLAIQGMFGGARRSLEDQLFAGRAASEEQEAQMLQSLAEMVMEQTQGVTRGAAQGRFGATEEAFGGKYGARKEDAAKSAAAAQSNAERLVAAAAASLGWAEADAAAMAEATAAKAAKMYEIDFMERERNIGGLEEEAAGKVSAQQMADLQDYVASLTGGAPGAAETVGLAELTGDTGFIPSFISRQQDMADEDYKRSAAMGVAESLIAQGGNKFAGHSASAVAAALENGWSAAFTAGPQELTWTQLMQRTDIGIKDIEDWMTEYAIGIELGLPGAELPALFAADIASMGP